MMENTAQRFMEFPDGQIALVVPLVTTNCLEQQLIAVQVGTGARRQNCLSAVYSSLIETKKNTFIFPIKTDRGGTFSLVFVMLTVACSG